ncbi:gtpase-activating protein gyp7 [Lichtheimia corymbifera JMRC:FSU:9682]|uniref:GTPase-activating protein GYP7 n=1 Tax=Lichtheimia corymbifera JMRC:FSU:9682 TaxID=1263082 RepID=A0A068RLN5_9FUNG|nr:gtpase-activating protein gyp7 [Lichtheimia corymbifera JMRC:FSU:9682]
MAIEDSFDIVNDPGATTTTVPSDPATAKLGTALQDTEIPVKLLYSKSKVYVHPSTKVNDFIPGYISIVEKAPHEYLIAWTPEALILSKDMEAFVQVDNNPEDEEGSTVMIPSLMDRPHDQYSLYALSSPLENINSVFVRPPCFTKWYGSVVLNFKDGSSSAPLWFHDDESRSTVLQKNTQGGKFSDDQGTECQVRWGGDEFMHRLCQLTQVTRSENDAHLYLVGERKASSTTTSAASKKQHAYDTSVFDSTQMDPWMATWKEFRWNALEKLSRITKFSRDAAAGVLNHPASRQFTSNLPPRLQEALNTDAVRATTDDYDSARIYLAKWAAGLAARSDQDTPIERRYRHVGIWGHGWEEETALGVFEVLNNENDFSIPTHTRTQPISEAEWRSFFDEQGRLSVGEPYIRKRIFCGGLDPSIRREAWLFLTDVFPWNSTADERERLAEQYRQSYRELRSKWLDDPEVKESAKFQDQKHRIDKDVHRTDRTVPFYAKEDMPNPDVTMHVGTNENLEKLKELLCTYNMYNTDLGYVQGMSDLLSPLYMVIQDDLVFQAFVGFMNRTKSNFYMDQSGMHRQLLIMDTLLQFMDPSLYKHFQRADSDNLFFCFRWFLVWFKRELSWDDTLTMWEVLWSDYLTDKFMFFVALAILDQHRDSIIDYLRSFDEIIKYINDLSMDINVQETLQRAEILFYQFKQRVEAVDTKREQLQQSLESASKEAKEERRDMQAQLNKLPTVSEMLRELIATGEESSNIATNSNSEKEKV